MVTIPKLKKAMWFCLGWICLGIAYIGVVTPGIPWSTPTVGAAYCFAKSSERMHNWIMNHRLFGPFLRGWAEKRVFPTRARWFMVLTMDSSLVIMWFTTHNWKAVAGTAVLMLLVCVWALRYPKNSEDHDARIAQGKKVGWFK
jgi:uncharacterized membrane protein YbaN (DUF454 family)